MPFFDLDGAQAYLARFAAGESFVLTLGPGQRWSEVEALLARAASERGLTVELAGHPGQSEEDQERRYLLLSASG